MRSFVTPIINDILLPERLNCPFYYQPHPLCVAAAKEVQDIIASTKGWTDDVERGKMFGVLIVECPDGHVGYVKAYSGQIGGREDWEGWVPPVFDYLQPDGYFKKHEEEISELNRKIADMERSPRYILDCSRLAKVRKEVADEIESYRRYMSEQKMLRLERRNQGEDPSLLVKESQYQKAEFKRMKSRLADNLEIFERPVRDHEESITALKKKRKQMSDSLQSWLFSHFVVCNSKGEKQNLIDIFKPTPHGVPPSGSGECCAPKLLNYAFLSNLTPVAIAEFWWGKSPVGEIRRHLAFYPACQGKCKPILDFMLQGVDVEPNPLQSVKDIQELCIVYVDDVIVVVEKPAGLLSVPGKGTALCVQDVLRRQLGKDVYPVHRLDMQTSGLLLFAFSAAIQSEMQKMFATRQVKKKYVAALDGVFAGKPRGVISLPLTLDYFNRPRQMVDFKNGKDAVTIYNIMYISNGRTYVELFPQTGRTHQLRVHCAYSDGLAIPIVGDDLYGEHSDRLLLHAETIDFVHPVSGKAVHIESKHPF